MSRRTCQFSDKNVNEFIPSTSERSFIPAAIDSSSDEGPLDEIALMRQGLLEKRSYSRQMVARKGPVTMEELMARGIQTTDGEVFHAVPMGCPRTTSAASSGSSFSTSSLRSTYSAGLSSASSDYAVFQGVPKNETIYNVGLPEERAVLKIGDSKNGKRYQLTAGDSFQILLDTSPEASLLVMFK